MGGDVRRAASDVFRKPVEGGAGAWWQRHNAQGRPWPLPLAERVLVVAMHYRTNLTMRQLGLLFRVSSSTV
ncbi:hypothetical protein GCM10010306_103210 [Streptomyces umbrinus]|nr:hypothetical protein GCM10010306_103210 [Streptomyces umbrinus]